MPTPLVTEDGCSCINCRLARIENQIAQMQQKVSKIAENSGKSGAKSH